MSVLFSYKEADIDDLAQVATLFCQFVYEVKEISNDPYFNFDALSNEGTLEWMKEAVHEGRVKIYIAKQDEDIIGFISGSIVNCFLPISRVGKVGYIESAYVIKPFRGNGVMSTLENMLTEHFKYCGLAYVELNVLSSNAKAKCFWDKANYATFREQMRKNIKEA